MTDRTPARFHGRDTGGPARAHLDCSATCRCGASFNASSLSKLRDKTAIHMADCDG